MAPRLGQFYDLIGPCDDMGISGVPGPVPEAPAPAAPAPEAPAPADTSAPIDGGGAPDVGPFMPAQTDPSFNPFQSSPVQQSPTQTSNSGSGSPMIVGGGSSNGSSSANSMLSGFGSIIEMFTGFLGIDLSSMGGGGNLINSVLSMFGADGLLDMMDPGGMKEGKVDQNLVNANTEKAMSQIDPNKKDIALWIPGTMAHDVDPNFKEGVEAKGGQAVAIDYQAGLNMADGTATSAATAKAVIDRLKQQGKNVTLTGYSQGAIGASHVMADSKYYNLVDSAMLVGHPVSDKYQWDGRGGKVMEINNANDAYTGGVSENRALDFTAILGQLLGGGGPGGHNDYNFRDLAGRLHWG